MFNAKTAGRIATLLGGLGLIASFVADIFNQSSVEKYIDERVDEKFAETNKK